jgi:hypothetical protein
MTPLLRLNDKTAKTVPGLPTKCFCGTPLPKPTPRTSACWRWAALPYYALPTKSLLRTAAIPLIRAVYVEGNSLLVRPNIDVSSPTSGDFVKVRRTTCYRWSLRTTTQLTALKRMVLSSVVARPERPTSR